MIDSRRLYAAVLFCSYTGCRRGKIMRVTKEDIDLDNRKAVIRIRKGRKDKTIRLHRVDLMDCLIPILKELIAQTPNSQKSLFSRSDDHLLDGGYNEELEANECDSLHRSLKTAIQDSKWRYVTGLHVYRLSFASMLFTSGMTDLEVMKIVGWDTSEMAAHYSHLTEEPTRERLSGILPVMSDSESKTHP
ncbi:MAG: tyrosine-type recombinase/integrase [Alphaproteobacteria bacterium]|nr:tyrosine-type recombinase/integrase [Alphaproteobacteria bacterium]